MIEQVYLDSAEVMEVLNKYVEDRYDYYPTYTSIGAYVEDVVIDGESAIVHIDSPFTIVLSQEVKPA